MHMFISLHFIIIILNKPPQGSESVGVRQKRRRFFPKLEFLLANAMSLITRSSELAWKPERFG